MGKINGRLKCIFIFFNMLFVIMGVILMYFAIKGTAKSFQVPSSDMPSLAWLWVFAIGILSVSSLGIYAAHAEKFLALKIFAGFMWTGMIFMMISGIIVAVERNQLECCGIVSAEDWGGEIPKSCRCNSSIVYRGYGTSECTSKPQGTRGPTKIYAQSCGELIFSWADLTMKIALGFCFGFAVTALLGLIITFFMMHQVKANDTGESIAMRSY